MIERLSGRRAFERLRREGHRHGRGPIRVVSRVDPEAVPRIAFAIPRSVGTAVVRNRVRRRIRAIISELHAADPSIPPPGDHLIRVTAPIDGWDHHRLRSTMSEIFASFSDPSPGGPSDGADPALPGVRS